MNRYTLADLQAGLSQSFTVTVTPAMLDTFCTLSGDVSPRHTDATFARGCGFPDRLVHGLLTAAFYSTLVGVHLPGQHGLLHGINASFNRPVFAGDTLTVSGTVSEVHDNLRQIEIKASISNQHGVKVSKATLKVGVDA